MLMQLRSEIRSRGRHRVIVEDEVEAGDQEALGRYLDAVTRAATSYAHNGAERRRVVAPPPEGEG